MYISYQGLKAIQDEKVARNLRWADEQRLIQMAKRAPRSPGEKSRRVSRHPVLTLRALVGR